MIIFQNPTFHVTISRLVKIGWFLLYPVFGFKAMAQKPSDWFPVGGEIASVDYTTVAYGGDKFVAAGNGRRYAVSEDGIHWTSHVLEMPELIRLFRITRVVPTENGWYALFQVSGSGSYLYAEDPREWPGPNSSTSPYYIDAARKVGAQVFLRSSRNSVLRILGNSGIGSFIGLGARYRSIATDGDVFVLCGEDGKILTSPDGASWTSRNSGTTELLFRIKYDENEFVCVGENGVLLRSENGMDWETIHSGGRDFLDVAVFRDDYYILRNHQSPILRCDRDGNVTDLGFLYISLYGIAASKDRLVACGSRGLLAYSSDGERWFNFNARNGGGWNGYAFVDGKGVLTRHPNPFRGLEFSRDLQTWHKSLSGAAYSLPFSHAGLFYRYNLMDTRFYKSADGLTWELAPEVPAGEENLTDFASVNGLLFAFSNGLLIAVLDDSAQWKIQEEVVHGDPARLRYEDETYILSADISNPVLESKDGLTWSIRLPPNSEFYGRTWVEFKGAFYSANGAGVIRSEDGIDWQEIDPEFFHQFQNSDQKFFIFNETLYVVNSNGNIFWSADGIIWDGTRVIKEGLSWISEMREFEGQLLAISDDGLIYTQTPHAFPGAELEINSSSKLQYGFTATLSDTGRLVVAQETSTDLSNWAVTFLEPEGSSNTVRGTFDLQLNQSESKKFHRVLVIDRNRVRGFWTGVLETELLSENGCQLEAPENQRVSYQLDWFPDNRITMDQILEEDSPVEAQLEGTIDPVSMEFELINNLNSECGDTVECEVSLSGAQEAGISLVIKWIEPVCGEDNCNFQRTLRLYR